VFICRYLFGSSANEVDDLRSNSLILARRSVIMS
jgi:hypothetical protein